MTEEKSIQVEITWECGKSLISYIRDFKIFIDNPEDKGGKDTGPTPSEFLLSSLGGCMGIGIAYFSDKLRINLKSLSIKVIVFKDEENSRIDHIDIFLHPEIEAMDQDRLGRCIQLAEKYCTVGNTLKKETKISIYTN